MTTQIDSSCWRIEMLSQEINVARHARIFATSRVAFL
jgi:hypothetical protein